MLTDPLDGLEPGALALMREVKEDYEVALAKDASASARRASMRDKCIALRQQGIGVRRIARYLNISDAYIYQITKEVVSA